MRREALKTFNDEHKAYVLCKDANKGKGFSLNTTKRQRKLDGAIVDGLVLGVNELADGKVITAVEDISMEFEKLRQVAEMV